MAGCSGCYLSCTSKSISSLWELQPGDHIRARGELGEFLDTYSSDLKIYTHHMLVVGVVDSSQVAVIHKTVKGVLEETRIYRPTDVTVVDYDCPFTGEKAIQRARERKGQSYHLVWSNCEHFVTEVKTGKKQSIQVQTAVKVGVGAVVGISAVVGGLLYAFSGNSKKSDSDSDSEDDYNHVQRQYA